MNRIVDPSSLQGATAEDRSLLRFITCGSVDDGKSTLIGRLLFEIGQIPQDQLSALATDSARHGRNEIDYSFLVDGLSAEREQGITIDVAYRYFASPRRTFIVADTPGHEQYTRNMASGASTADLAVILVDAQKGLLAQTRRHALIVALLGVPQVILAVNKMDCVAFDEAVFGAIEAQFCAFAGPLGFHRLSCLPLSAKQGDNIAAVSQNMPWYAGPTLLQYLEMAAPAGDDRTRPFRMPVQWVNRPHDGFRGFAGLVAGGRVMPGSEVQILPSGLKSRIERIVSADGDLLEAVAGQAVTLVLADAIDVARGDWLVCAKRPPMNGQRLRAKLLWLAEVPLDPAATYVVKTGSTTAQARLESLHGKVDIGSGQSNPTADSLALNEIGLVTLQLDRRLALDSYGDNRETGGFILIDRLSHATLAAGFTESLVPAEVSAAADPSYASMEGLAAPVSLPREETVNVARMLWPFIIDVAASAAAALLVLGDPRSALGIGLIAGALRVGGRSAEKGLPQ
jgi:sulfate adenylyltransferase large subunit